MKTVVISSNGIQMQASVCETFLRKLRGLLWGHKSPGDIVLVRCSGIHTFGMRKAIDVCFVSRECKVLRAMRNVLPGQTVSCKDAYLVVERFVQQNEAWFKEGQIIHIEEGE